MHLDLAQERAARAGDAQKEEDKGSNDGGIYTNFDGGEDDDKNTGQPDNKFQRRGSPVGVNLGRGSYEISDSVNDDCGKAGGGDPVERVRQAIESDDDTDGSENTSDRGPDTGLGFECRTREGTGGRIGTEARSDSVGNTDGNQFLIGVNLIIVDTSKSWWDLR